MFPDWSALSSPVIVFAPASVSVVAHVYVAESNPRVVPVAGLPVVSVPPASPTIVGNATW